MLSKEETGLYIDRNIFILAGFQNLSVDLMVSVDTEYYNTFTFYNTFRGLRP
jgi:hypothetical protein